MTEQAWIAILLLIAVVFGVRGSFRLTTRYQAAVRGEDRLVNGERLLLGVIVIVAWFLTGLAIYLGVLSLRRLIGFEPLAFTAQITTALSFVALLIPAGLDLVVERIARGRRGP